MCIYTGPQSPIVTTKAAPTLTFFLADAGKPDKPYQLSGSFAEPTRIWPAWDAQPTKTPKKL